MKEQNIKGPSTAVLGVAIVNYFSYDSVATLLQSLRRFSSGTKTIVQIVDNSLDLGRREHARIQVLSSDLSDDNFKIEVSASVTNLGYGAGNNLAIASLLERGATLIWVLNPDTVVEGSARALVDEAVQSNYGIWSTTTIEHGTLTYGLGTLNTLTGQAGPSTSNRICMRRFSFEYPGGHSIVFSEDSWRRLGGFDMDYFLFMEEADLAIRSSRVGIKIGTLSNVIVHHSQGLTTGSSKEIGLKSLTTFREATKSRVIFFRKHYPIRLPLLLASRAVYMIVALVRGNRAGAASIFEGIVSGLKKPITTDGGNR